VEATGDRGDSQLVSEADLASNRKMKIQNQCCAPGTPSVNSGCSALVRRKARAIPKEDYVYGSPIVDNYRVQHAYWFDNATPEYKRPWMIQVGRFPANVNVNFNPNLNAQADLALLNPIYTYGTPVPIEGGGPMTKIFLLTILCGLEVVFATAALARTPLTKAAMAADNRRATPLVDSCRSTFVCRQDLFDRNNRNNLRFDWPSPPAQAGQF
jgi:hypothetical protein